MRPVDDGTARAVSVSSGPAPRFRAPPMRIVPKAAGYARRSRCCAEATFCAIPCGAGADVGPAGRLVGDDGALRSLTDTTLPRGAGACDAGGTSPAGYRDRTGAREVAGLSRWWSPSRVPAVGKSSCPGRGVRPDRCDYRVIKRAWRRAWWIVSAV